MAIRIKVVPDYDIDAHEFEIFDLLRVFSIALHAKPWSLVEAMRKKRHMCPLDDEEFEQACRWVMLGSEHEIRQDTDLAQFIVRRAIDVLDITHEQELNINTILREMVAYDKACVAEPYYLPQAAE